MIVFYRSNISQLDINLPPCIYITLQKYFKYQNGNYIHTNSNYLDTYISRAIRLNSLSNSLTNSFSTIQQTLSQKLSFSTTILHNHLSLHPHILLLSISLSLSLNSGLPTIPKNLEIVSFEKRYNIIIVPVHRIKTVCKSFLFCAIIYIFLDYSNYY